MFEVNLISAEEIIVQTLSKKLPEGEYLDKTFAVQEMVKVSEDFSVSVSDGITLCNMTM